MQDFEKEIGLDLDGLQDQLLEDLENQSIEELRMLRADARMEVKIAIQLRPANSRDRHQEPLHGVTADLSRGGCRAMMVDPPHVGDVYRMTFAEGPLELPMVFARCLRVRLVREDIFDAGFRFFSSLDLVPGADGEKADLFD